MSHSILARRAAYKETERWFIAQARSERQKNRSYPPSKPNTQVIKTTWSFSKWSIDWDVEVDFDEGRAVVQANGKHAATLPWQTDRFLDATSAARSVAEATAISPRKASKLIAEIEKEI